MQRLPPLFPSSAPVPRAATKQQQARSSATKQQQASSCLFIQGPPLIYIKEFVSGSAQRCPTQTADTIVPKSFILASHHGFIVTAFLYTQIFDHKKRDL